MDQRKWGADFTVFTDSQVAMSRIQNDAPGLVRIIDIATALHGQGNVVTVRQILGHRGVAGNEVATCMQDRRRQIPPQLVIQQLGEHGFPQEEEN